MSRESKLVKNTLILSIGTFFPKFAAFITLPILTKYLSKSDFGIYDIIITLVSLVLPVATLQIQTAAFRFLIEIKNNEEEVRKIVSTIFIFIFPTSIGALVILYFCLFKLSVTLRLLICGYFFADIVVNAARQVARGIHKNMDYSFSAIISAACKIIFVFLLVMFLKMELIGAVIALGLSSLFSLLFLMIKTKMFRYIKFEYANTATLKSLLSYSWPLIPNSMSLWVMNMSDRLVITSFMGTVANAIYAAAYKVPSMITLAQNTFTMAWQESASIASKDSDANKYYSDMFKQIFNLLAGFMGLIIGCTPLLFKILIQGDYSEAYPQMPILFMGLFFSCLSSFLGGLYIAYKATKSVGITTIIAAAINLVIDLILIKFIGIYAASISTLVSYIFLFSFRMIDIRKFVKIRINVVHMLSILMVLVVQCILCFMQITALNVINITVGIIFFIVLNKGLLKTILNKAKSMLTNKHKI